MAVKASGPNPDSNPRLRTTIERKNQHTKSALGRYQESGFQGQKDLNCTNELYRMGLPMM